MKLQIAIDILSIDQAMTILEAVAPYVDLIEAGTPLIKKEGLRAVELFKEHFPDKLVVADMKTMDAGELEAGMAFKANADFTTVLAVASDSTIQGAIAEARKYGKHVVVDLISVSDKEKRSCELENMGVNYIGLHSGWDEQAKGQSPLIDLQLVKNLTRVPLVVAGGINEATISQVEAAGASIAIVGSAICNAKFPGDVARCLRNRIKTS